MANKNRLIDANVVLAKKFTTGLSDASGNYYGYADVVFADDIENAPTVDAVEVCRCKDCSYAKDMHPLANAPAYKMGVCTVRKEDGIEFTVWGQDFCSYGERREGE